MQALFLENKTTKRKFRVIKFDKEEGRIYLKGDYGEFDDEYDKERFKKMGYEMVQGEVNDDAQQ